MKSLVRIIIFILSVFILDRGGALILKTMQRHSHAIIDEKINYAAYECKDDILLFGSSRCHHHYIPSIITEETGKTCYNVGVRGGSDIYFNYALLQLILRNHKPQLILYDLISGDFSKEEGNDRYKKLLNLSPYFGIDNNVDSLFYVAGYGYKYLASNLYKYNGKWLNIVAGNFFKGDLSKLGEYKYLDHGYQPLFKQLQDSCIVFNDVRIVEDRERTDMLVKFIEICKKENITILFYVSPAYSYCPFDQYEIPKRICNEYNIPFINHINDSIILSSNSNFSEIGHLNHQGAIAYSKIVGREISVYMDTIPSSNLNSKTE